MKWINGFVVVRLINVGLLLLALDDGAPYGYYVLLRWITCAVFAYTAFRAFERELVGWTWVLGITGLIFNPILPLRLGREMWAIADVAAALILLATFWGLRARNTGRRQLALFLSEEEERQLKNDALRLGDGDVSTYIGTKLWLSHSDCDRFCGDCWAWTIPAQDASKGTYCRLCGAELEAPEEEEEA